LIGGAVAWFVSNRSKDPVINTARHEKGTLIASGFIAGGALMGVISAIIKFVQNTMAENKINALGEAATTQMKETIRESHNWFMTNWAEGAGGEWLSLAMYTVIVGFFIWYALRKNEK